MQGAARGQRREHARVAEVRRERRHRGEARRAGEMAREVQPREHRGRVVGELPVLDRHPLRPAGRAGGEQHVGQVLRTRRGERRRSRGLPPGLEVEEARHPTGKDVAQRSLGEHRLHPGVRGHRGQPLRREGRVERHVGAACPQHPQHRHDHRGRALGGDAHPHLGPDPEPGAAGAPRGPSAAPARRR